MRPPVTGQRDRALAEQLVTVGVSVGLRRINARVAREPQHPTGIIIARRVAAGANHVPWRVAQHGVESAVGQARTVSGEEHFGALELPMEEPVSLGDLLRGAQILAGQLRGERSAARKDGVRQRAERLRGHPVAGQPGRTPQIGDRPPSPQSRSAAHSSPRTPVPFREPAPRCRWAPTPSRSARASASRRASRTFHSSNSDGPRSPRPEAAAGVRPAPGRVPRAMRRAGCCPHAADDRESSAADRRQAWSAIPTAARAARPSGSGPRRTGSARPRVLRIAARSRSPMSRAWQPPVRTSAASYAAAR